MILGILLRYGNKNQGGIWDESYRFPWNFYLMAEKFGITLCGIINYADAKPLCEVCDGLIIPGSGNDIFPQHFGGEPVNTEGRVDEFAHDSKIIDLFVKAGKPIFGICQGIQTLNVFFGGTLKRVNVNCFHGLPREDQQQKHTISIQKGSFVYDVFGKEEALVNSHHNWGVDRLAEGFTVVATAEDGVIEAMENKEKRIFATQWHPELHFSMGDPIEQKFFENFIEVCRK